jgi:phosphatidylethanolamine-binding protein (PEBP) family uncharacterized protein
MKYIIFYLLSLPLISFVQLQNTERPTTFTVKGKLFNNNGFYPKLYTCDSLGISPAIEWENLPVGSKTLAITMHHFPKDGDKHVYMVLYNIPSSIKGIKDDEHQIGVWGQNTQNKNLAYSPPCSKGPGAKTYIITVYALSEKISDQSSKGLTMDQLFERMNDKILAKAIMNVQYTR